MRRLPLVRADGLPVRRGSLPAQCDTRWCRLQERAEKATTQAVSMMLLTVFVGALTLLLAVLLGCVAVVTVLGLTEKLRHAGYDHD